MIDKKSLIKLDNQMFKDVVLYDSENPTGKIIGRNVRINIINHSEVVIIDNSGVEMLRKHSSLVTLFYHQGWGGINLVYRDGNDTITLTLHYINPVKTDN
jgi:hypothetical protein